MKILVLGGTQYFGRRLVKHLVEAGNDVTVVARGHSPMNIPGAAYRNAHRSLFGELKSAVGQETYDVVYDQVCFSSNDAQVALRTLEKKVGHYVLTSSQGVTPRIFAATESSFDPLTHNFDPQDHSWTPYAEGKRRAEAIISRNAHCSVSIVRIPYVVGPDDYCKVLDWHVERILRGEKFVVKNPSARISLINSATAAAGLFRLSTYEKGVGPIHFASPRSDQSSKEAADSEDFQVSAIRISELIGLIEDVIGKKAKMNAPGAVMHSRFAMDGDVCLSIKKAQDLGFHLASMESYLRPLIELGCRRSIREANDLAEFAAQYPDL